MDNNISPEEILRRKEIAGGIEYDDPQPVTEEPVKVSQVQELSPRNETAQPQFQQPIQQPVQPIQQQVQQPVQPIKNEQPLSSLGKAQSVISQSLLKWVGRTSRSRFYLRAGDIIQRELKLLLEQQR